MVYKYTTISSYKHTLGLSLLTFKGDNANVSFSQVVSILWLTRVWFFHGNQVASFPTSRLLFFYF